MVTSNEFLQFFLEIPIVGKINIRYFRNVNTDFTDFRNKTHMYWSLFKRGVK